MLPSNLSLLSNTSGAATTASRLGHPDLAIATMNDFVEVDKFIAFLWLITDTWHPHSKGSNNGLQLESISTRYSRR